MRLSSFDDFQEEDTYTNMDDTIPDNNHENANSNEHQMVAKGASQWQDFNLRKQNEFEVVKSSFK